jgi:3-oxocholest-4-en-26-oate---CoA ligase
LAVTLEALDDQQDGFRTMEWQFATLWEIAADAAPEETAIVQGRTRRTYRDMDDRASRLAAAFVEAGLLPGSKVALYLYNSAEFLEANFAALKQRLMPVNVNYRYLDAELEYVLDNCDAEALVFHTSLADRVEAVRDRLPKLRLLISVDDGPATNVADARSYSEIMDQFEPAPRIERSEDDLYIFYTGGTTGYPKGVLQQMGPFARMFVERACGRFDLDVPADLVAYASTLREVVQQQRRPVSLALPPLMHGTGLWIGSMMVMCAAGQVVLTSSRSLDPDEALGLIEAERVTFLVLVGDAMSRPLLASLRQAMARGRPFDTSSLDTIYSSGVMWTSEVKAELLEFIPQAILVDGMGSTEGGMGVKITRRGETVDTARFLATHTTKVFTPDGREVQPGSDEVGMIASGGSTVPLGYYKDPEKTARTFREIGGVRYSFPGDWGRIEADGTLVVLGRGSQCINTGGEKVFPEEVEEVVKLVPGVEDCLVVGMPDERFGQRVAAVVAGTGVSGDLIIESAKGRISGYKVPRTIVVVDRVPRFDNGKPDYRAAAELLANTLTQDDSHTGIA